MGFPKSFQFGKEGQAYLKQLLEGKGFHCEEPERANWDLLVEGVRFEVKFDRMESVTGNLAIEFYNPKSQKPSGLLVTQATFWVVVLGEPMRAWACRVEDLLNYFVTKKGRVICGGDGNSLMVLYPSREILPAVFVPAELLSRERLCNSKSC